MYVFGVDIPLVEIVFVLCIIIVIILIEVIIILALILKHKDTHHSNNSISLSHKEEQAIKAEILRKKLKNIK